MSFDNILQNLNASQHAAVSSVADTLAILAGPGSGKTHTLTSRTAWLLHQGLQPWNIIVATFTVKAAREMKERIGKLIGNGLESKLVLGTFHSISRRYLARYGHLINIRKDFGIADSGDSLAIIKRIVKRRSLNIDPAAARSRISSRKAKGDHDVRPTSTAAAKSLDMQEFEICYTEYEEALNRSNLLDYDDLLLRCVELLRAHPSCVSNVEAVLIDEFQDTNLVQFDLMRLFASQRKRITIVGDPDQSIYGFRSAETKNFKRMQIQYPETVTIALEENYRSSGAILLTALGVIEQDTSRIAKSLMPTHTIGTRPVLRKLVNAHKEAEWLVSEIQRCLGLTGGLMDLNDFAILLRSASLSRLIESALGKAGIAYRMVGGHRFYDRVEVKVVLDYLRVINQPDNNDALARIINIPSRRIGETTIKALLEEADQSSITLWSLIIDKVQGNRTIRTKLNSETERSITKFVDVILTARQKIKDSPDGTFSTVELMDYILRKTSFHDWLERKYSEDCDTRWANIQELRTQAGDFEAQVSEDDEEALPEIEGLQQDNLSNPLSKFLANVALASGKEEKEDGPSVPQVTISTIHAAKGLEWPVVFIPAAYQGSIPHSRAEDANEERRLLYVAMTRAKALLYMSLPLKSSQGEETVLSPFLAPLSLAPLLDKKGPTLGSSVVQTISQILGRSLPSAEAISKSSSNLRCLEDSLFTVDGIEDNSSKWTRWEGQQDFSVEQRAHRHQNELNAAEDRVELPWKGPSYATTMDNISKFTTGGFVSAGSHLNVLGSVSLNQVADFPEDTSKSAGVKSTKRDEGQKSILGFIGKAEPQLVQKPKASKPSLPIPNPYASPRTNVRVDVTSHNAMLGFPPSLGNHRIGPTKSSKRPQPTHLEEPQKRNEYVFLSSSPPRPKRSKLEHEIPSSPPPIAPSLPGTTKPSILPLIRPPKSGLKRSISDIQKSGMNDETLELPPLPRPASRELKRSHSENIPIAVKSKSKPKFELIPELPVGCSARTLQKAAESVSKSTKQQTPQAAIPTPIISEKLSKEVEAVLKEIPSCSEPTRLVPPSLGKAPSVPPQHATTMHQPLTRPATTFHTTTTMSMLQGAGTGRKTLGMRRSMTGWQSQKGKGGFKPPTIVKRVG